MNYLINTFYKFVCFCFYLYRVVEELLSLGADPDLGDDFSSVFQVGTQMKLHTLEGRMLYCIFFM